MELAYHLVNVFVRDGGRLTGNPLCVFEPTAELDTPTMQAVARQFNLSETTFLSGSLRASARVRIFTPDFEMPFAGHPTLGTAHVVRQLGLGGDALTLEMRAGVIPVAAVAGDDRCDHWSLQANAATCREVAGAPAELASALGLTGADLRHDAAGERPLWVDSGTEQLLVPLVSAAAMARLRPRASALEAFRSRDGRRMVYAFAEVGAGRVDARFLFEADGEMREDPATGSACANLGGWYLATAPHALPLRRRVHQGDAVRRPSTLWLDIAADRRVHVSGVVVHLGRGLLTI
jgi:trans-2,3-dihydro-3-hydroxyanthranilate isomerase